MRNARHQFGHRGRCPGPPHSSTGYGGAASIPMQRYWQCVLTIEQYYETSQCWRNPGGREEEVFLRSPLEVKQFLDRLILAADCMSLKHTIFLKLSQTTGN